MSSKLDRSSRWETLVFWLVKKLSRQITSCDCSTRRSQMCEPRNPAAPVTKMRLICAMRGIIPKMTLFMRFWDSLLCLTNFVPANSHISRRISRVDDQLGVANDEFPIERGMVGDRQNTILANREFEIR